ncbi:MAG: type II secretion system F family protein [Myxococcales bacterium]|nr:type II secretion system F family protein [Myxococcales bacterium]
MSALQAMLERLETAAKHGQELAGPFRELARSTDSAAWRTMNGEIAASLDAGTPLAVALERHGALIPPRIRRVLGLAEADGNLARALDALLVETTVSRDVVRVLRGALLGPCASLAIVGLGLGIGAAMALPEAASWFAFWRAAPDGVVAQAWVVLGTLPRALWVALGLLPAALVAATYRRLLRFDSTPASGLLAPILRGQSAIIALLDARIRLAGGADIDTLAIQAALTPLSRCVFAGALPSSGAGVAVDDALDTAREELDVTTRRHSQRLALALLLVTASLVLVAGYALISWQHAMMDAPHVGVLP